MLIFFVIQCAVAFVAYRLARTRGRNPIGWAIACFVFPPAVFFLKPQKQSYDPDTGIFKLKGFVMDTKSGTFTIDGFQYHKSAVREVQWLKHNDVFGGDSPGKITIVVNDIEHPVHNIVFPAFQDFEAQVERMKMLLCS